MFTLQDLSYFEFKFGHGYVSKYPSDNTVLTEPLQKPAVFNITTLSKDDWNVMYDNYFRTLFKANFGINDIFWWIPNYAVNNPQRLYEHIRETVITPIEYFQAPGKPNQMVQITNGLFPEFKMNAYFTNTSLPQQAIDVVPFFVPKTNETLNKIKKKVESLESSSGWVHELATLLTLNNVISLIIENKKTTESWNSKSSKIYTALGYKKESDRVPISLSDGQRIDVLTTGIYGNVIFGEHLEASEKSQISTYSNAYMLNNSTPIFVPSKRVSAVVRTLAEEAGISLDRNALVAYIDCSHTGLDQTCRDIRYGNFDNYGYPRRSTAHTMCCFIFSEPPKDPIPIDHLECDRPFITTVNDVDNNFGYGGAFFQAAFPAHRSQLESAFYFLDRIM